MLRDFSNGIVIDPSETCIRKFRRQELLPSKMLASFVVLFVAIASSQFHLSLSAYDIEEEKGYPTRYADSPLLKPLLDSLGTQRHTPETRTTFKDKYDYIIVGAGAAGSVVAARLSEVSCVNVLLLEAGKPPPLISELPTIFGRLLKTHLDWNFVTVPQKYSAFAYKGNKVPCSVGKTIGGSTILNAMNHVRGNKLDFDDWEQLGATGWNYTSVLPYFKKMEDNKNSGQSDYYHGSGGPLTIEGLQFRPPLRDVVVNAAEELGYSAVNTNENTQIGVAENEVTMRGAQRCSTAKAYLVPVEKRSNLDIVAEAFVKKVIIVNGRATGVRFDFGGEEYEVDAAKEVILSAGAINSAQLLLLSGIGPRKHLEGMQIPVLADLPVGKNLMDHIGVMGEFVIDDDFPIYRDKVKEAVFINQYIDERKGPLTTAAGFIATAFLRNDGRRGTDKKPDTQIYFSEDRIRFLSSSGDMKPEVKFKMQEKLVNKTLCSCSPVVLNPRSRGSVKLRSKNPYSPPIVDPKYFKDPYDVQDAVKGLKFCQQIIETAAMRRIGAKKPFQVLPPDCEPYKDDLEKALVCYARHFVFSLYHYSGTAKMGDIGDSSTVVGPDLRVKNIDGLRVVDASVMPKITSGNIMAPTIMIAEKASNIIKQDILCDR